MEYLIDTYLAFQFDFRLGYRCVFNFDGLTDHTFDWGLNFGLRYTFCQRKIELRPSGFFIGKGCQQDYISPDQPRPKSQCSS